MKIIRLTAKDEGYKKQVAELWFEAWPEEYEQSYLEVEKSLEEGKIALLAIEGDIVLGFIGAIPQYGQTGWELHPLIVRKAKQFQGIGTLLLKALEKEVQKCGGVTIYLGTDDIDYRTTLSGVDLYEDTFEKIVNIKNLNNHPYEFYEKNGYKIVGVTPDANGIGKPDIWMSKRI